MIISSISYKGGVGKSTFAQNLAVVLAHIGYKVCLIDADKTLATTSWSGKRLEKEINPAVQVVELTEPKSIVGNVKLLYKDYDVIIIDSPPALSPMASKILFVSHLVVIPVTPTGGSDLWVTEKMVHRYLDIAEQMERPLPAYFLINRFESNVRLHKSYLRVLDKYEEEYGVKILESKLGSRVAYGEANARGIGVVEYDNKKAKKEVNALVKEIIEIYENI